MKVLGLDLGIASVGASLINIDYDNLNSLSIDKTVVRIFDTPQTPKDKISLQKIRGEKKRARNSFQNYHTRRKKIINILIKYNLIDVSKIKDIKTSLPASKKKIHFADKVATSLFYAESTANNILDLRYKALNEKLNEIEFARLLYSMNNHRGVSYEDSRSSKSISEEKSTALKSKNINDYADGSSDKLLYGLLNFKEKFDSEKYRTVGEFLYKEHKKKFRNTPRKRVNDEKFKLSNFLFVIPRINIVKELEYIFNKQIEFGNILANNEFKKEYINSFSWEKEGESYKNLVSNCLIKENEKASTKHALESILYVYLEKLYNLSYKTLEEKRYVNLNIDEILVIINSIDKQEITFEDVKKTIAKTHNKDIIFKGVDDYSKKFIEMKVFKQVTKILGYSSNILDVYKSSNKETFNNIIEILAYETTTLKKEESLELLGFSGDIIEKLVEIKIKGNLSYCNEVLEQMCNGMMSGLIPHYAKEKVEEAYPKKKIIKSHYLPPILETDFPIKNNQVVVRALSQMRLVVNDLLEHYRKEYNNPNWFFDKVVIETGREFASKDKIDENKKRIASNEKLNIQAKEFCEKYGKNYPSREEILKARLYLQQKGMELYPSKYEDNGRFAIIEAERLFDESYCEIDHILPISRSLDDSFANKTLVLSKTNQLKGNKTPYEYMDEDLFLLMANKLKDKELFKILGYKKISNLTKREFDGIEGFIEKDLNNTRMITKYACEYINKYLGFPKSETIKRRVFANNGQITSLLRKTWGIGSKNRNSHLHHGENAILIALSNNSLIKNISTYYGIQSQLENFNFNRKSFDILFKNNISIKEYIIGELKKEGIDIDSPALNIKKKDLSSKVFRIVAKKSYPREDFLRIFRKSIDTANVTHREKIKNNGEIHKETIDKLVNKKNDDAVLVRGGFANNGDAIRYDVFKNTKGRFEFVKITAKYHGLPIEDLPFSKDKNSSFVFSIYPKSCLHFIYEENKELKEAKGLFRKIDNSLYIDSIKNIEDEQFRFKLNTFTVKILLSDDLPSFEKDEFKKVMGLLNFGKFDKKNRIETEVSAIIVCIKSIKKYFTDYNTIFTFGKTTNIETFTIKEKLLKEGEIIENRDEELPSRTILITIEEDNLISPFLVLASTKIKSVKKIKTNSLGNETIIEKEKRLSL